MNATFIRMSDLVADTIGKQQLPGGYDALMAGSQLIETSALGTFENLLSQFSYPIEPESLTVSFDGRDDNKETNRAEYSSLGTRFRTLGVWDGLGDSTLPFFPLPDELRRAMRGPNEYTDDAFLRFATLEDFQHLTDKRREYVQIWRDSMGGFDKFEQGLVDATISELGNLDLMEHIGAGTVQGFLPLYYSTLDANECAGKMFGGAYYAQPALYVDALVCRNTGTELLRVDDFFGTNDATSELRLYSPTTPAGESRFDWRPVELAPGESVVAIQRLLFSAFGQYDPQIGGRRSFSKAIFGPTQLPKGIVMGGESYPFDGRSHNTLIVASYAGKGSCPYLSSWCDQAQEWVQLGKVLTHCNAADLEGEDSREFGDLRTKFKLVEREHERTTIRAAKLEIETLSGEVFHIQPSKGAQYWPVILDIGQMVELEFDTPVDLRPADVTKTRLRLRGYYENYLQEDFERCRELALA